MLIKQTIKSKKVRNRNQMSLNRRNRLQKTTIAKRMKLSRKTKMKNSIKKFKKMWQRVTIDNKSQRKTLKLLKTHEY